MAQDKSYTRFQGLLIPDPRIVLGAVTADDHATAPSSFTERGPKAGVPEANQSTRMVLRATGTQSADGAIGINTVRAGNPGIDQAGFLWEDQTVSKQQNGWDGPQLVTHPESIFWASSSVNYYSAAPDVIRLQSGKLLMCGHQNELAGAGIWTQVLYSYDPSTSAWSAVGSLVPDGSPRQEGPSLLQLPSGEVLFFVQTKDDRQVDVYSSADDGATWEPYAFRVLDISAPQLTAVTEVTQIRARYSNGEVLLAVVWLRPSTLYRSMTQAASEDLGGSFETIVEDWQADTTEPAQRVSIVPAESGGFIIGYGVREVTTIAYGQSKIGSAFSNAAAERDTLGAAIDHSYDWADIALWRSEDGQIYRMTNASVDDDARAGVQEAHPAPAYLEVSSNDGESYREHKTRGILLEDAGAIISASLLTHYAAADIAGRTALVTRWDVAGGGPGASPHSLSVLWLGGHSDHTAPLKDEDPVLTNSWSTPPRAEDGMEFSRSAGTQTGGGFYLPILIPGSLGWTAALTGTEAVIFPGVLEVTSTPGNARTYTRDAAGDWGHLFTEFAVEITAGTPINNQVFARYVLSDGAVFDYRVEIRIETGGFNVWDGIAAASVGVAAVVSFGQVVHVRVAMDRGNVRTWYSTADANEREWTEGPSGAIADNGAGGGDNRVRFGHAVPGVGTIKSEWTMFGYSWWPGEWSPRAVGYASAWSRPRDINPRPFSTVPATIFDGVKLAAISGPARYGDEWNVEPAFDHPLGNAFWEDAPSPRQSWRSTADGVEEVIAIDLSGLGEGRLTNYTIGIAAFGINFKQAALERWDGAAWQDIGQLHAETGFTGLQFQRDGEIVTPDTGVANQAERFIVRQELVGGTFVFTAGEAVLRKISRNTEGTWTDSQTKRPWVSLEDVDDTEPGSGACEIWAPQAATVIHEFDQAVRYLRLRIPAQKTADGYYQIGQLLIGEMLIFGTQYSRGREIAGLNQTDLFELPDGSTRARKRGPQYREIEFSWSEGIDASQINKENPDPDYSTGSAAGGPHGRPIAAKYATLYDLEGAIVQLDGAVKPCVYFSRIEQDQDGAELEVRMNDPRLFVYGRITSDTSRQNILGDEVRTNLDRMGRFVIREIV